MFYHFGSDQVYGFWLNNQKTTLILWGKSVHLLRCGACRSEQMPLHQRVNKYFLWCRWTQGIKPLPQAVAATGETGKVKAMKSFVMAVVAMVVIGAGAHFGLAALDRSAGNVYVSDNVRQ